MLNFAAWLSQRETTRELSRLSDRQLADLGIARSDISAIVGRASAARSASQKLDTMAPSWAGHNRRALAA